MRQMSHFFVLCLWLAALPAAAAPEVVLSGRALTIEQVVAVARGRAQVKVAAEARERLKASRALVYQAVEAGTPVYGMNRGVGLNKDRTISKEALRQFNDNVIRSHSAAAPPYLSEEQVRAALVVRLNALLLGRTGCQPALADAYADLLNRGIHPLIPSRGTVGEADITLLSHVGLTLLGEGEVHFRGQRMPARTAFQKAKLKPLELGPKDGLAVVSSNAVAAGWGALVLHDAERLMDSADVIYALSLEGLNGNLSPLDPALEAVRPYQGQLQCARQVRTLLTGSYLLEADKERPLQDPLSFRTACHVNGAVRESLRMLREKLEVQLNSSDDNPAVVVERGVIISTGNFSPISWVLPFETASIALAHVSKGSCHRTLKLGTPAFTKLSRFLTPADTDVIAFGAIQKTFGALDAEIRMLANPVSLDFLALAGEIEDSGTNSALAVDKTERIVDALSYVLAIEAMHAAQAIDLRKKAQHLGAGTGAAYRTLRAAVPFLDRDRALTPDIQRIQELIRTGALVRAPATSPKKGSSR